MKKWISALLLLSMILSFVPEVAAETETGITRYTVLVLDNSGTSKFINTKTNETIYEADSALSYVKDAAEEFIEDVLLASGEGYGATSNKIAIVTYRSTATTQINFTDNKEQLLKSVKRLSSSGTTRSIAAGLERAEKLLDEIKDSNAIKNVVLIGTGYSNHGDYSYEGRYDENVVGSNWHRIDTDIHFYAYANSAHVVADRVKAKANLYSLGIFQTMENVPEEGKKAAEFFRLFAKDLASNSQCFIAVDDPEEIEFAFTSLAVAMEDFDGDGLPNKWETDGADIDGDGVVDLPLDQWGADPEVPDVFVEVDWMVRPATKGFLGFNKQEEKSFAPSEKTIKIVYESFKKQGIHLHVDVGPESIDFVTGKKWGKKSGGNEIPYKENFDLGNTPYTYEYWDNEVTKQFDQDIRGKVFRHAMFINKYNNCASTGIARGIPDQFFIVALLDDGSASLNERQIAGTFMHELGHTLGLKHGGNNDSWTSFKPNHLSIMNYAFQMSGLVGTNEITYSSYDLMDLQEDQLDEKKGIDPQGVTKGTGIGTKLPGMFGNYQTVPREIHNIAQASVDFNDWWGIQDKLVEADLNVNGQKNDKIKGGTKEWDSLIYQAGNIGGKEFIRLDADHLIVMQGIPLEEQELSYDDSARMGLLGNAGAGSMEAIGPYSLIAGKTGQSTYVRVNNLAPVDAAYTLIVDPCEATDGFTKTITVPASIGDVNYTDIPIPMKDSLSTGNYTITATLQSKDHDDTTIKILVEIATPTEEQLQALKAGLSDETAELSDAARNEYKEILGTYTLSVESTSGGTVSNEGKTSVGTGETIGIEAQVKEGYRFIGWKTSNGGIFAEENSLKTTFTMPKGDTVLTACFEKKDGSTFDSNHCLVRFESNGGSKVEGKAVAKNGSISQPAEPVKEAYKFMGWYTDKELTKAYDFSSVVTRDMTLYAMWEDIEFFQIKLWIGSKYAKVFGMMIENDVAPQVVNDRTMLPIRFVAEALGATVNWTEAEPDKVQINKEGKIIDLYIGSAEAYVDGNKTMLDSPAFIENDRTFLPVRFISENLGAIVAWDEATEKVTITK